MSVLSCAKKNILLQNLALYRWVELISVKNYHYNAQGKFLPIFVELLDDNSGLLVEKVRGHPSRTSG